MSSDGLVPSSWENPDVTWLIYVGGKYPGVPSVEDAGAAAACGEWWRFRSFKKLGLRK